MWIVSRSFKATTYSISRRRWHAERRCYTTTGRRTLRKFCHTKSHSSLTVIAFAIVKTIEISMWPQPSQGVVVTYSWYSLVNRMRRWRFTRSSATSDRKIFHPKTPSVERRRLYRPSTSLHRSLPNGKMTQTRPGSSVCTSTTTSTGSWKGSSKSTRTRPILKRPSTIASISSSHVSLRWLLNRLGLISANRVCPYSAREPAWLTTLIWR